VYLQAHYRWQERLFSYAGILAAVMVFSMVVVFFVAAGLQSSLTGPILAVSDIARRVIANRDYSLRAEKSSADEIGVLVDAFNGMLAEIGVRNDAAQHANEALEHQVEERLRAEESVRQLNAELEQRVLDRTAQLERANKELESFSYSVSHDLRAPLRAITGFANLLVEDHGSVLNPEAQRKLTIIQRESLRMGSLIDDLLAFSRLGRKVLNVQSLDMTAMARQTYDSCVDGQAHTGFELQLSELPVAQGDAVLLGQVWVNLLSNAIKFSANREHPLIEINAITDDKDNIYFVRDNGAGFDPRYQSKLFEVFQRLHDASEFPGTGVGLALVQRIVARHGGRVWAVSQLDNGATFYFALPREPVYEEL
jgi:light-regulated signal transduction histidine kinase (bacteriophytochrome)/HAMP domain-containing protein